MVVNCVYYVLASLVDNQLTHGWKSMAHYCSDNARKLKRVWAEVIDKTKVIIQSEIQKGKEVMEKSKIGRMQKGWYNTCADYDEVSPGMVNILCLFSFGHLSSKVVAFIRFPPKKCLVTDEYNVFRDDFTEQYWGTS